MTKLDISASAFVCKQPENQGGKPGLSLVPQNTGEGQMWHLSWKTRGNYKAESLALVPMTPLGQTSRLLLSPCKITRRWVTGNVDLSGNITSNQSNFLQWKGNRSCGEQRSSSVIHLDLSKLSATLSHDILTGKLRKDGLDECTAARKPVESSTHKVVTEGSLSKGKDTPAGLLRGSARSLVIFNIFINDHDKASLLNLQVTASREGLHMEDRNGISNDLTRSAPRTDKKLHQIL